MTPDMPQYIQDAMRALEERDRERASELGVTVEQLHLVEEAERTAEERAAARFEARRIRIANLRVLESRIPAAIHLALCRGQKIPGTPALREVHRWRTDPEAKPILVLHGGTGAGKTVACAYTLATTHDAEYVHAHQLAERVRPWAADIARGVKPARLNAHLLVVDDLGTEEATARVMEAVYAVIDERQGWVRSRGNRARARTIITTNLGRKGLLGYVNAQGKRVEGHVDARVAGRLVQLAEWASAGETDLRLSGRADRVKGGER